MEDLTYELPLLQPTAGSREGRVRASAATTKAIIVGTRSTDGESSGRLAFLRRSGARRLMSDTLSGAGLVWVRPFRSA